jgi:hypothetical protein
MVVERHMNAPVSGYEPCTISHSSVSTGCPYVIHIVITRLYYELIWLKIGIFDSFLLEAFHIEF